MILETIGLYIVVKKGIHYFAEKERARNALQQQKQQEDENNVQLEKFTNLQDAWAFILANTTDPEELKDIFIQGITNLGEVNEINAMDILAKETEIEKQLTKNDKISLEMNDRDVVREKLNKTLNIRQDSILNMAVEDLLRLGIQKMHEELDYAKSSISENFDRTQEYLT